MAEGEGGAGTTAMRDLGQELEGQLGNWQPEGMLDFGAALETGLPGIFESLAAGIRGLAERGTDEHPLDPKVADALNDLAAQVAGMSDSAKDAHQMFETAHETELSRLRNPRTAEQEWDVSAQA